MAFKRAFDVVFSSVFLIVFSPVYAITAILIKIASPGPVFFKKKMLGFKRSDFEIFKFRTMIIDAHLKEEKFLGENGGRFLKVKNDPRITPLGKVLRKYSIDELPQMVNVLKGDMSLVGPRPIFGKELQQFEDWKYLKRFRMKPGLTCIWQVSGRSRTTHEERMRYDIEYVDNWSLSMDFKLLAKTIPVVLTGDGAE
jgi:lipopolysaccharide/colanic/teichoic acid biosynthesis glycosyltransferase